jgi:hypothetical protein
VVAACRARVAHSLRWFTTRAGLLLLTCLVSVALLGYVYNSLGAAWELRRVAEGVQAPQAGPMPPAPACTHGCTHG